MKLKNLGTTVINIGKVVILPDETAEVADKAYENNAAINYLAKTNRLEIVKETKKPAGKNDKKPSAPAEDNKADNETPAAEQE